MVLAAWAGVRLYPVDETGRDGAFRGFVKKLRAAVEDRNAKALRKLVDSEVVVGREKQDAGWARFEARWRPGAADSPVWAALADLLALGFVREHPSLYVSPYLVFRFPREMDRTTHVVVIRDDVALRVAPSLQAAVEERLSFDIVERVDAETVREGVVDWLRVRTAAGRVGFVNARDAMSPLMPRAQFALVRGRWAMVALEGD